ncbi:MAG: molybdate ABC transporter substrate-binding protein [Actinomycetota bacterium]
MRRLVALGVAALTLMAVGCGSSGEPTIAAGGNQEREITVFAASSLTAAFTQIGKDFEATNPGLTVTFNFGPSDGLAGQIESEGVADVFASASPTWMDDLASATGVTQRTDFAQNKLVIITPPDDPAGIGSIQDLAGPSVQLVLAAVGVPVGDYARQVLRNVGIAKAAAGNVVSNEQDDASVVAKIASGEADAGIVYASDVTETVAPTVHAIEIPSDVNVIATYPIAVVDGSKSTDLARAFVRYVSGPDGQATLRAFGFLLPT